MTSPIRRAVRPLLVRLCVTGGFAKVAPRLLTGSDLAVHRLTRGKLTLGQILLPMLMLTTTGRRSGLPRTTPLACFPHEDGYFLIASNFGRPQHPSWSTNLLHEPRARIHYEGRGTEVTAHLVTPEEHTRLRAALTASGTSPIYDAYISRCDRTVRMFNLRPIDPTD